MNLSSTLLALLKCPVSGNGLIYDKERKVLISKKARLEYPIRDGIPILLKAEAKTI